MSIGEPPIPISLSVEWQGLHARHRLLRASIMSSVCHGAEMLGNTKEVLLFCPTRDFALHLFPHLGFQDNLERNVASA